MADITQEVNIDMLEKLADGNYKIKYPKTKAEQVVYDDGSTAVYHSSYAVASGTNSYTVNIPGITSLIEGMSVKVKFTSANTGACTLNINGLGAIPIKKSNGNDLSAGNIKAGQICHLVYTGSVFQLLGEGGEYGNVTPEDVIKGVTFGTEEGLKTGTLELTGDATTTDVLSGKTFYSTNPKSKLTGTMSNRGAVTYTITTQGGSYTIPAGYHNGSGKVTANFANLIPSNIRDGVIIGGVRGSLKPSGYVKGTAQQGSRYDFVLSDGSPATGGRCAIEVTRNFGFTPSTIIVVCYLSNSEYDYTIYSKNIEFDSNTNSNILNIFRYTDIHIAIFSSQSPVSVTKNGFVLPIFGLFEDYQWIAIA